MAELLMVMNNIGDENTEQSARYFAGDPIDVQETGAQWGAEEDKAPNNGGVFFILTITDKTKAEMLYLMQPGYLFDGITPNYRHLYNLVVSELSSEVQTQIAATGRYSATWSGINTLINNKDTNVRGG